MLDEGIINKEDYGYWKISSKILTYLKKKKARFIIDPQAWNEAYHNKLLRVSRGYMSVDKYLNRYPDLLKSLEDIVSSDRSYLASKDFIDQEGLKGCIIYSDGKSSYLIRTNITGEDRLEGLVNKAYDESFSLLIFKYLEEIYKHSK